MSKLFGITKKKTSYKAFSAAKILFLVLTITLFSLNFASSADFDNVLRYKNKNLTVEIINNFGLGAKLGEATLTSHESVDEIRYIINGDDRAVMYYEFNFSEKYKKGLGDVEFTDVMTGKKVKKDYYFAKAVFREYQSPITETICSDIYDYSTCIVETVGYEDHKQIVDWIKIDEKDIPDSVETIGILTSVSTGDYIDAVWEITGKKVRRHAAWTSSLNTDLVAYYPLNELVGGDDVNNSVTDYATVHNATTNATVDEKNMSDPFAKISGAYNFTDKNTSIDLTQMLINTTSINYTIVMWLRHNSGTERQYFYAYEKTGQETAIVNRFFSGNYNAWGDFNGAGRQWGEWTVTAPPDDTWFMFTLQFTTDGNGEVKAWINQTNIASDATVSGINVSAIATHAIGKNKVEAWNGWGGYVDEVGIWLRYLSEAEIQQLYNDGTGLTYEAAIYLNAPEDNYENVSNVVTFNCSAFDADTLDNLTLIIDGVLNQTVTGSPSADLSLEVELNMSFGTSEWTCNATDVNNDVSYTSIRSMTLGYSENSQNYTPEVTELTEQEFTINITYNSTTFENIQGFLVYNGTSYAGTNYGWNDTAIFNRTITVPSVSSETNFTFYWDIRMQNGASVSFNSTANNQSVLDFQIDNCSTNDVVLYNFTMVDEVTQNKIGATTQNTTADVSIKIYSPDRSTLVANFSNTLPKKNSFEICLNSSLSAGESYSLDMDMQYYADIYAKESYHIQRATITSDDLNTNITLYDLLNSSSQVFSITYKDENLLAVEDALIQVQRKYIADGVFKTVEIPKTDYEGKAIAHIDLNDVIYTFIVVKNGVTLATFNNVIPECQNPSLETCEINLNIFSTTINTYDFSNVSDFYYTLTYDNNTRTIQSIYSIPSSTSATVQLNATLSDNLGTTQVCGDTVTGASGTLTCVVPSTYGNGTAYVELRKDGTLISHGLLSMAQEPKDIYGDALIFLSLFLFLTLIGVGVGDSPVMSGVFLIVGMIIAVAINLVGTGASSFIGGAATILWLVIAIIIILIKGSNRM